MNIDARLAEAWARLPDYLGSHVLVSITALAIGLGISLPLAILSTRRPLLRGALLAVASVIQTIPGIALLALFYPLLLAIAALTDKLFGLTFSALGFLPSVLALALYSMLPVLRNTVTGLNGLDPSLRDAARVVGMKPAQSLREVELPLALPVIMAGIRTSAVWVIGTATLSTPIGQTSLGNYIFAGLQTQNWVFVIFGCVAAAVLALVVDQLLALMEYGVAARSRMKVTAGAVGLVLVVLAALVPGTRGHAQQLRGRHQELHRAIHPGRVDPAAPRRQWSHERAARRARLGSDLQGADGERRRPLCRLFRHHLGERHAPQRRQAAR